MQYCFGSQGRNDSPCNLLTDCTYYRRRVGFRARRGHVIKSTLFMDCSAKLENYLRGKGKPMLTLLGNLLNALQCFGAHQQGECLRGGQDSAASSDQHSCHLCRTGHRGLSRRKADQ